MATSLPRQKLFGTTTSSSTSLLFLLISTILVWIGYILCGALIFISSPVSVTGEVLLEEDGFVKGNEILDRNKRSFIPLDGDDYFDGSSNVHANPFNNPAVLEGGENGKGRSNDGYESLRQLSLASSQPFIRRRLFNTSVALTVPMFSFTLPQRAAEGSTVDLANQAIFGLFALLTSMLVFAVPVVFTGVRPFDVYGRSNNGESTQDILGNLMKAGGSSSAHIFNLMGADLKNKVGLNPDQCLQKTICDAHRYPKKYGLFALPFQLFFPPPTPGKEGSGKAYSMYQKAAETGEYKTTEECWEKYNCFFDIMDLAIYFVDYFNNPVSKDQEDEPGIEIPVNF